MIDVGPRAPISFANASPIQKTNHILDQILDIIKSYDVPAGDPNPQNTFLETEGILRESGQQEEINRVYEKMMRDPDANRLAGEVIFKTIPHNVIGLLKKMLEEMSAQNSYHPDFQEDMAGFLSDLSETYSSKESEEKEIDLKKFEAFIQKLNNNKMHEEARLLHNIFYLCNRVSEYKSKNKMSSEAIAKAMLTERMRHMAPQTKSAPVASTPQRSGEALRNATPEEYNRKTQETIAALLAAASNNTPGIQLIEAMKEDKSYFGKRFDEAYPKETRILKNQHAQIPQNKTLRDVLQKGIDNFVNFFAVIGRAISNAVVLGYYALAGNKKFTEKAQEMAYSAINKTKPAAKTDAPLSPEPKKLEGTARPDSFTPAREMQDTQEKQSKQVLRKAPPDLEKILSKRGPGPKNK